MLKATATAGAETHLRGKVPDRHALSQALPNLPAVDIFADTYNHDYASVIKMIRNIKRILRELAEFPLFSPALGYYTPLLQPGDHAL